MPEFPPPLAATVIASGDATGDRYAVLEVMVAGGADLPHHVHRHEDVYVVVLEGAVSLLEDADSRTLAVGDHARMRSNVPWQGRAETDARLLVALMPAGAERLAGQLAVAADAEDRVALLAAAGVDLVPVARPPAPALPSDPIPPHSEGTNPMDSSVLRYAAFTTDPAGGNPAGVVLDASRLDDAAMQRIAAEVGYSETAFVTPHADEGALRVRYFSPVAEVPFCGHATIAAAVARAERLGPGAVTMHTQAGIVEVGVAPSPDGPAATLTSVPPRSEAFPAAALEAALGLLDWRAEDLDPALPVRVAYAGARHLVLATRTRARLADLEYDFDGLRELMLAHDLTTLQLVHRVERHVFHARDPFPVGGVVEDPATGAAAAALGGYLREHGLVSPPAEVTIHQGAEIGRPSVLRVAIPASGGIRVTGTAVRLPDPV
jgi:PhzF family phenazine biosynthesis protein